MLTLLPPEHLTCRVLCVWVCVWFVGIAIRKHKAKPQHVPSVERRGRQAGRYYHKVAKGATSSGINLCNVCNYLHFLCHSWVPHSFIHSATVWKTHWKILIKHKQTNFPASLTPQRSVWENHIQIGDTLLALPMDYHVAFSRGVQITLIAPPPVRTRAHSHRTPGKCIFPAVAEYPWECEYAAVCHG